MEAWLWPTLLLCLYGFFKEIRPSEPFLNEYLTGPWKNITDSDVNNRVYPVWTYSYLGVSLVVFIVTDFLRYKPVIVVQAISYIVTWVLLLWVPGVLAMQFMQFVYGIVTAADVAYYTYIYAKVPTDRFKKVTSLTRSAILFGRFLSGVTAQTCISTKLLDYHQLNYISLSCVSVAMVISLFLPSTPFSIYFHRRQKNDEGNSQYQSNVTVVTNDSHHSMQDIKHSEIEYKSQTVSNEKTNSNICIGVWNHIWSDFKAAYTNSYQLKWCLWWALATCGYEQVGNYIQPLWKVIYPTKEHPGAKLYNGGVTATNTLLGALVSAVLGFLNIDWSKWGELTLAVVSLLDGALLMLAALTNNIWVAYVSYALYICSYDMLITVVSFQVARRLKQESYGLVFGINTFIALLLQSVLTLVLISELEVGPRKQFIVYSVYTFITALLFIIITIQSCFKGRRQTDEELE